ncbi:MAG: hypothetical protein ACK5N4_23335 [Parabacteroides gordonii]|uniref:hypothetical protein n=1 Tax=Parabacteroides gordonii TaxID=574930 RepID=UPI003A837D62
MKRFIPACLLLAFAFFLLLSAGCSSDTTVDLPVSGTVTLLTRSVTETAAAHRLLVFGADDDNACKLNYSFTSGNAITLDAGKYRFVTLTETACFDLPGAGVTAGVAANQLLTLKEGATLEAVQISQPAEVTLPAASYTAVLQPAACLFRLTLKEAPADLTLHLKNMPAGLSLSGSYTDAATKVYPLKENDNICLPTVGSAVLQYRSDAGSGELDLGMAFEAGYTYSVSLQWHNEELKLTSNIEAWENGSDKSGNAEME